MKKTFAIALVLGIVLNASAQDGKSIFRADENAKLTVATAGDGLFNLNLLSHIGYGWHFTKSPDFTPNSAGNGEFFFNVLEFELRPWDFMGMNLGVDMEFNHFHSDSHAFQQNSENFIKAVPFTDLVENATKQKSGIFNFGLNFPLVIKGYFSRLSLGLGAELSLYLTGDNHYSFVTGNKKTAITETSPQFKTLGYGLIASVSYSGLGLYFKYYPSRPNILPSESISLSYWTMGISFGF